MIRTPSDRFRRWLKLGKYLPGVSRVCKNLVTYDFKILNINPQLPESVIRCILRKASLFGVTIRQIHVHENRLTLPNWGIQQFPFKLFLHSMIESIHIFNAEKEVYSFNRAEVNITLRTLVAFGLNKKLPSELVQMLCKLLLN